MAGIGGIGWLVANRCARQQHCVGDGAVTVKKIILSAVGFEAAIANVRSESQQGEEKIPIEKWLAQGGGGEEATKKKR